MCERLAGSVSAWHRAYCSDVQGPQSRVLATAAGKGLVALPSQALHIQHIHDRRPLAVCGGICVCKGLLPLPAVHQVLAAPCAEVGIRP